MSTTPLDAAREHLSRRLVSLDHSQTWRERAIISPLFDVADMVCRVGDHPDSLHYRADKSGDMVSAALRVRGVAFEQYAGIDSWPEEHAAHLTSLHQLNELAEQLNRALELVLWDLADVIRGGAGVTEPDADAIDGLNDHAQRLARLAHQIRNPDAANRS
jgi:hypothetical protein